MRRLQDRNAIRYIYRDIFRVTSFLFSLILASGVSSSSFADSASLDPCEKSFQAVWSVGPGERAYIHVPNRKSLKKRYHYQRNKMIEGDVPAVELEMLDIIFTNANWIPKGDFLLNKGHMAANFDVEIALTKEFVVQFQKWKNKIRRSGALSEKQLKAIDISVFTRAILINGGFNVREIFNLSLIFDDLYGSHLFEYDKRVEINQITHFLSLRRQLALVQSTFIAQIHWDKAQKQTKDLPLTERFDRSNRPAPLKQEFRAKFMRAVAKATTWMVPPLKRVVNAIFKTIEPASPVDPIGTNIAKQYLEKPWMPKLLNDFRVRLLEIDRDLSSGKISPENLKLNVFDVAVQVAKGDQEKALVLVGLMSIQRKALIRNLARHYKEAGTFEYHAQALIDSVAIYYLITDIAETVDYHRSVESERYTFLYPKGYRGPIDNKFYHFWSEAFFAHHLRKQGYSHFWVRFGLQNVGRVYELATSISGVRLFKAYGMTTWEAFMATKMSEDIKLHRLGVEFGLKKFTQLMDSAQIRWQDP